MDIQQTVLPFSTVTKNPADINISQDGSAATTFTFDSPVFVNEKVEYCFVVYSTQMIMNVSYQEWVRQI